MASMTHIAQPQGLIHHFKIGFHCSICITKARLQFFLHIWNDPTIVSTGFFQLKFFKIWLYLFCRSCDTFSFKEASIMRVCFLCIFLHRVLWIHSVSLVSKTLVKLWWISHLEGLRRFTVIILSDLSSSGFWLSSRAMHTCWNRSLSLWCFFNKL